MAIFSDLTNEYKILDFSPTHSQLLLRSMRGKDKSYNVDIQFKAVSFISIPSRIKGIEIDIYDKAKSKTSTPNNSLFETDQQMLFSLTDADGGSYFLAALAFGVFHNTLDILESSLGRYDYGLQGELVLWHK